jgi:hypothetical protein
MMRCVEIDRVSASQKGFFARAGARAICLLGMLCGLSVAAHAAEPAKRSAFLDFNYYPYMSATENDNFLTINAGAKLGNGLSYFSLNNFGEVKGTNGLPDKSTFYSEQNLRWAFSKSLPLDLTAQLNFRNGENNDRHRLGIRWRLNDTKQLSQFFKSLNLVYALNFHLLQIDHEDPYVWQIEHAFMMKFPALGDRLYLAGFIDHTFNQNLPDGFPARPVVAEAQAGFRIADQFHVVAEYRINEYRRSDVDNLAIGLQYKFVW